MRQLKIVPSNYTNRNPPLARYLVEIGRQPLLTIDEEIELAQKRKQGGREGQLAVDKLVKCNLRFVVSVAKQYLHRGLSLTDLIEEGNIGLVKAAWKFDETRGFKFISYAVWWIRQSILQAIAEKGDPVRTPLNQKGLLSKIWQESSNFIQKNHRAPSPEELAEIMGIDAEKIRQCMMADINTIDMDAPIQEGEDGTIGDRIASGDDTRADKGADRESMAQDLNEVLSQVLNEREIKIMRYCFGIGCHEKGLEEIGDELKLTRERVRQIRERCVTKLRNSGHAKILAKYLG